MKLGIYSHCTIDEIKIGDDTYETPGGPACYCSLTARKLGFDVALATKFGSEFDPSSIFEKNKITLLDAEGSKPTTRFVLEINHDERSLWLRNMCDELDFHDVSADGILVSPVFDEVSKETFEKIKKSGKPVFLDPQGFLRRVDSNNRIFFERTDIDLTNVSVLKSDPNEVLHLTGEQGLDGVKILQKKVEHVLFTNKRDVSLFYKGKQYSISLPNVNIHDTVGVGDIFTTTFCCTLLKERDILWALSFAGGAAQAALESKQIGLNKVPMKGATESNASYFYNVIKFRDV